MIRMTTFVLALCSMLPLGHSFIFESSRTNMMKPVPQSAILRQNAAYPPEFHRYVKAQLAAGKGDELKVKFDFDVEAYAAAYDKKVAAQLEANDALQEEKRRRLFGTPSPTSSPLPYSLPPTPSGATAVSNANSSRYIIGVDFEQVISQRNANQWCRFQFGSLGWGVGQSSATATIPYKASVLGGIDKYIPANNRYNQLSTLKQIAVMKTVCEELDNGACWIGLFWKYNSGLWKWRGWGDVLDDSTASWATGEPKSTFLQTVQPDEYCAIMDDTRSYDWVSTDCIPSPTNVVKTAICYNTEWRP